MPLLVCALLGGVNAGLKAKSTLARAPVRMLKAVYNGVVIAESDDIKIVDGNNYYPAEALKMEFFSPIDKTTTCSWKGTCNYYDVSDGKGAVKPGGAWVYKTPKAAAAEIANHVAFYPFVTHVK